MRNIYTIGEVVYDIIFKNRAPLNANPGGSMLNTAVSLGRIGLPVSFIGETGTDKISQIILDFLSTNNISTKFVEKYQGRNTTVALAFLDSNNDAEYVFHKDYPQQRLTNPLPIPGKDDIVLFGSSFAITKPVRQKLVGFLETSKKNGAIILYDPNFRKQRSDLKDLLPLLEENIQLSDIVRGSDEDFFNIFGLDNTEEIYTKARALGCQNLIITRNKNGVSLKTASIDTHVDSLSIKPISTIGAGDNFNAGLIYSICKKNIKKEGLASIKKTEWEEILGMCVEFSSNVCLSNENYLSIEHTKSLKF